ncbi:E3 ubiquitin-protein ligase TRIM71, partial [Geodia barretti]
SPAHLLSTKCVLAERAAKLQKEYQVSNLSPSQSSNFLTDISDQPIISKIISLGWVSGGGHPASSTCNAGYLPRAVVGVPRTIKVVAHDNQGKALGKGGDEVAAKLVQTGSQGPPITSETINHGDGTYSVSITPEAVGEHELHVTLDGLHVNGSPFKYSITNPRAPAYTALSTQYIGISTSYPYDVALTEEGYLAVAEYGCHTVSLYSATGQKIHTFGKANSYGSGDGQFYHPSGIAIRGDLMYVCEQTNKRVQKFSVKERAFISKFGTSGEGNNQLSNPLGICIDPEGKVFIADYGNIRIQVFNKDDSFAYSIPCQGNPWGLAFGLQGHLHVAASTLNCIHVFTPDGTLVTSYGSGTIYQPAGIAIDAEGYIAISEIGGNNRLWIYNPDHTLVHTLYNQFKSGGFGIACDNNNSFWVTDFGNNRLVKY